VGRSCCGRTGSCMLEFGFRLQPHRLNAQTYFREWITSKMIMIYWRIKYRSNSEWSSVLWIPVLKHFNNSGRWPRFFFQLRTAAFKAYCAIWVRRSNFRHQSFPRVSPRESTQRRKVELWARNVTFRDLSHAVKLRHGTDGFTSPPKGNVLRNFSDGFGRVRTRELGYQRPARYL
jgi:hypothetical protein